MNGVNLLNEVLKAIPNIQILNSAGLHKQKAIFGSEISCELSCDLPVTGMGLAKIQFVSNKHNHNLWLCMLLDFINPLSNGLESLVFRNIVNDKRAD